MQAKKVSCFQCGHCGKIFWNEQQAEFCCNDAKCKVCGKKLDLPYMTVCQSCSLKSREERLRKRWEAAKHVPYSDYCGEMMYLEGVGYFSDAESLVDAWADNQYPDNKDLPISEIYEFPELVWGTKKLLNGIDADLLIEEIETSDLAYEDYQMTEHAKQAIRDFAEIWNRDHAEYSYWPDESIAIDRDDITDQIWTRRG